MTGLEIGIISVGAIIVLVYSGLHIAIALSLVSFLSVLYQSGSTSLAINLLTLAATDGIANQTFAVIPLFVMMGLLMNATGVGRDAFDVGDFVLHRLRGGLGLATVASNAVFAAVTGVSIASAAVFTRVAVPEMLRLGYSPRFAVGTVAGSSVLGMLIPPSVLLIVYAIITDQSIGRMFFAGIGPGIILSTVYCLGILAMAYFIPSMVFDPTRKFADEAAMGADRFEGVTWGQIALKLLPIGFLIFVVLGGIYGGVFTPTEAGAVGALFATLYAVLRGKLTLALFVQTLRETGYITAAVCFLIIAATMYSRSLAFAGVPSEIGRFAQTLTQNYLVILFIFVLIVLVLGTIIDAISIMLIVVPLFLPIMLQFGVDPIWFGIITTIAVEVGLLTPPLGMACFVIKSSLTNKEITLEDVFIGALPFAAMMLFVIGLLVRWPHLIYIDQWFG
ncbi:TRAP transporter large permease [Halovulum dunhuangense]|uniref:TRAP transporter large permease protein n=1 Tax=Halovulum dunhuangense TaxID=1505036 RepID=A0A849L6A8_9RHOB|nr:TRAP transporter large permease [Halovulum dunhuangense]NNU82048.1 TRAP transporter large permease [Halovulum dunhuangense]